MIKINRSIPADKIKLVIFDLDGTLVDSRLDLANSINAMLKHFGKAELPCDVIAGYIGDGAPMLVRRALCDPDDEAFVEEGLDYFLGYYREHKLDNTYVYEGVKEALAAIAQSANGAARRMAVLTNKPVRPSQVIVDALGLGGFFVQVYGGNSFHTKKPDPQGAHALLDENGVQPQEAVMVGDSEIDVLTARNAGMYSIGLSYGFAPHTLVTVPPDVLVDTPQELAQVLAPQHG
ncbi:MAG: HAD-IA family hydrolase [Acidobacteriota bacterium]|nr:HAD-IA family hydrolase [Acidobacteriota bacterium]